MRLVVENLAGERGDNLLFSALSASLTNSQALIVTGPNGAGKSTLLRIIAGLLPPSEGAVRIENADGDMPVAACSHYLNIYNAMKPSLSVYENLKFWQDFHGSPLHDIDEALEIVELYNIGHLPYGYLSTGQKRRVGLATLLCSYRPLWLLDEPTTGLDAQAQAMFAGVMRNHLKNDGMIVAITHIDLQLQQHDALEVEYLPLEDYQPDEQNDELQGWSL